MTVPLHILVADDYPQVVGYFKQYLETYGHRVETAANGIEAINALQRCARANDPIHLVLADVIMPLLDGVSLVKEMRRDRQGTPVALMTGSAEMLPNLLVDAQRLGCLAVMNKPIDPGQLAQVLAAAVAAAGGGARPVAPPVRDTAPALERHDNTRSYQPSTATVNRQHQDDPFRPLTAAQYPPQQYAQPPAYGQPPQYAPQQPGYGQPPQYAPQAQYAPQPPQTQYQPAPQAQPQAPLAPPLPPPMTSRNTARVDLPVLDLNAIRVADRGPSGGYPLPPAPPATGSGGFPLTADPSRPTGSGGYPLQQAPTALPPSPSRDFRQSGAQVVLPSNAQPPAQRDLRQSGAQPLPPGPRAGDPAARDPRYASQAFDPRASNSGTRAPADPRYGSGAQVARPPQDPRYASGANQIARPPASDPRASNSGGRPPIDPRYTSGASQVARPPGQDPRASNHHMQPPQDPRYSSGATKPAANDPRFASGANPVAGGTNRNAPIAYPVGRTGTPAPGAAQRSTTSGIYPPGTIPTNTVPAPGGYQRTNSAVFQAPTNDQDANSTRVRRGVGGNQGQGAPTNPAPPPPSTGGPPPNANTGPAEAGRMLACAYCGGAFRAAIRPAAYNLVCVHCGQLNRIDP
jgi:CheY-like chemotaxis protein